MSLTGGSTTTGQEYPSDEVISAKDYVKELATRPKIPGFLYGIDKIDALTEGVELGELVIVTGYSGHGKTSFTQTITSNFDNSGVPCLWFSYEVTPQQFFRKFPTLPNFHLPRTLTGNSMEWLESKVKEGKRKFGTKVVFIDHLHYLIDMIPAAKMTGNDSLVIGGLLRRLKRIALEQQVAIFLIAHTKQPKDDEAPSMNSIRDSSFIAQESDAIYAISRLREKKMGADLYTNDAMFQILKQRRTGTMGKRVKLTYTGNKYVEADKQFEL